MVVVLSAAHGAGAFPWVNSEVDGSSTLLEAATEFSWIGTGVTWGGDTGLAD